MKEGIEWVKNLSIGDGTALLGSVLFYLRLPPEANHVTDTNCWLIFHSAQCSYKVGEDEFGYMLAGILKQNKVKNSGMRFDPAARIALAFVTLRSDGERDFMFFRNPSADMLLRESELDINLIKQILGATNLADSSPGIIRGDFVIDIGRV